MKTLIRLSILILIASLVACASIPEETKAQAAEVHANLESITNQVSWEADSLVNLCLSQQGKLLGGFDSIASQKAMKRLEQYQVKLADMKTSEILNKSFDSTIGYETQVQDLLITYSGFASGDLQDLFKLMFAEDFIMHLKEADEKALSLMNKMLQAQMQFYKVQSQFLDKYSIESSESVEKRITKYRKFIAHLKHKLDMLNKIHNM